MEARGLVEYQLLLKWIICNNKRERSIISYSSCDDSDASSHIYFKRHFFEEDEEHEETIVLSGNKKTVTKGKIGVVIDDKHVGTILGEMKVKDLVPDLHAFTFCEVK